jgi:Domain of unknown function (DUF3598)
VSSQWAALLKNVGEWHGSFTQLSPSGVVLADVRSIVSLTGTNQDRTMRQVVTKYPNDEPTELVLEYDSLGRGVLFHDNGAFAQGSMQWAPYSQFGAEFGLIDRARRLRVIQLYDRNSKLDSFTLIRERLATSQTPARPQLSIDQLLGTWHGEATTLYADWRNPSTYTSQLQLSLGDRQELVQELSFDGRQIKSTGVISDDRIIFTQGDSTVQVLMLPDGASATCPVQIIPRQPFILETGWLLAPDLRQRLIRIYDAKGEWISLTLVVERKLDL